MKTPLPFRRSPASLLLLLLALHFSGCATAPSASPEELAYGKVLVATSYDPAISRLMQQRATAQFPTIYAAMARATRENRAVVPPTSLERSKPVFPLAHRKNGTQGIAWVAFVVDHTGAVILPVALDETEPLFNAAAIAAVQTWKYHPARVDGTPIEYVMVVPIVFVFG